MLVGAGSAQTEFCHQLQENRGPNQPFSSEERGSVSLFITMSPIITLMALTTLALLINLSIAV